MKTFWGYRRQDSRPGVRNYIAVVSTVSCANTVAEKIASQSQHAIAVTHDTGCLQFGQDRALAERTIKGMASHPNAGAVILVGLGCEQVNTEELAQAIDDRPCQAVIIQKAGGTSGAVKQGVEILRQFEQMVLRQEREEFPLADLIVAVKCGGSDFTNAIASNPALGKAMDLLVAEGGTALLTETPGFPGSEHVLASRAVNREVADKIWEIVDKYRNEVRDRFGLSISDGNPSPGNMAGGITTLAEKSLGNIKKGGASPIQGVLEYAQPVEDRKGLWIMETPGHDVFSVSGAAAGGAQLIAFTTGRGTPLGCALVPVVKICASPKTAQLMAENIDLDLSGIMDGTISLDQAGSMILEELMAVASGRLTSAERLGHFEFAIPRIGSTL